MNLPFTAFTVVEPPRRPALVTQAGQGCHVEHPAHAPVVAFRAVQVAADPTGITRDRHQPGVGRQASGAGEIGQVTTGADIVICDGLKGLPEAIDTVWELAVAQTCIIHLIRNTFRFAPRQHWDEMSRDLTSVYTAPTEAAVEERFVEVSTKWGPKYPAIVRLWENAWSEFVPFLDYDVEIRRVICEGVRDRVGQCPLQARDPRPWASSDRAVRSEMSLSRDPGPGPDRSG